jgi:signal transduction histidine kinase
MDAEQRRYVSAIQAALSRMHHMATNILSLERAQAAKQKPETPISLNHILAKSVLDTRDEIRLKGHTLNISQADRTLMVYGNDTDLNEAINNLLNNAAKFTPEGGRIDVRLFESQDAEGEHAVLEVEDNGFGIEEEHQACLFQPFFRIKNDETQHIDGTGIGMYLVKKIVEYHGGQVFFRSTFGQGSTVGFRLPLKHVEER